MPGLVAGLFDKKLKGRGPFFMEAALAALGLILADLRLMSPSIKVTEQLLKASEVIGRSLDLKEALGQLVEITVTSTGLEHSNVGLYEAESNEIVIAASHKNEFPLGMRFKLSDLPETETLLLGRPLVLDRDSAYVSPQFKNFMQLTSVESAFYSPLMHSGKLIGIMCAGSAKKRKLTERQIEIATGISNQAAIAIQNATLYTQTKTALEKERHIAEELQRSLLPEELPDIAHTELGAYYASSTEEAQVGGDFYDLITLSDKNYAFIIGDVSGKGVTAAASTAMVKYIIRTFLYQHASPAFALSQANSAISKQMDPGIFVTVFCAIYNAETGYLTYSNAGHPRPYCFNKETGSFSELVDVHPALTLLPEYSYRESRVLLTPQSFVAAFTDGTFETRRNHEFFGEDRLSSAIQGLANLPAQAIADGIADACLSFSNGKLEDDIAVLVLKHV